MLKKENIFKNLSSECHTRPDRVSRGMIFNNKEYHTAGFPLALRLAGMTEETGRSMVEMLGVLAVIGVLSVAGIAGYNSAMNKHRANEILNEASKRAVVVAMQVASGKSGNQLSVAEFGDNAWSVTTENLSNQFGIKSPSINSDVCKQVVNSIGAGTVIRKVLSGTTDTTGDSSKCTDAAVTLIYNNDMSTTDTAPAQITCEDSEKVSITYTSGACCTYQKTEKVCPGFEPPACTPAAACACTTQDCCTEKNGTWMMHSHSAYYCLPNGVLYAGNNSNPNPLICNVGEFPKCFGSRCECGLSENFVCPTARGECKTCANNEVSKCGYIDCVCGQNSDVIACPGGPYLCISCSLNQKARCDYSSCTCEDL